MRLWFCLFCIAISFMVSLNCKNNIRNYWQTNGNFHLAALILARGGSKGIPLKNLAQIGGIPLLTRTIDAIQKTPGFSSVWVSTDHFQIYEEAKKKNVNIYWRSLESAKDNATSIEAVQEFIKYRPEIDGVALVQCTSPFLKNNYLKEAIELFRNGSTPCVFSITRSYKLRWTFKENKVVPLNFDHNNRPRRQDLTGELIENGMFYFAVTNYIINGHLQSERCKVVEIPARDSLEIDTSWDLWLARKIVEN